VRQLVLDRRAAQYAVGDLVDQAVRPADGFGQVAFQLAAPASDFPIAFLHLEARLLHGRGDDVGRQQAIPEAARTWSAMSVPLAPRPLSQAAGPRSRRQEQTNLSSDPLRIIGPPQQPQVSLPLSRCLGRTETNDDVFCGPSRSSS